MTQFTGAKPNEPSRPNSTDRVRASDGEREEYAQILRAAMAEGRLTMEIGEERLGQAYGATYRDELEPLIADLPRGAEFRTPEFLEQAGQRLRRHRNGVVSVAALLVGIWLLVAILAHPVFFWPIIPIAFLTMGFLRHRRRYRWWSSGGGWGPRTRGWDGASWHAHGPGPWGPGHHPGWGPGAGHGAGPGAGPGWGPGAHGPAWGRRPERASQ